MDIDVERDVLPWIDGDPTGALAIVTHPHNTQLVADSQGFHYAEPGQTKLRRLRGLTGRLAECFWATPRLPPVKVRCGRRPSRVSSSSSSAQGAARGMLRGNIVHRQIQALVSLDAERFHRTYADGAHPWSQSALEALLDHGMRPLASEVNVADVDIGVATSIDMVAVRRDGSLVFIEWKTGYEDTAWTGAADWMRGPLFGFFEDSARNRAIVQVVLGAVLACKSRDISGPISCVVAHITSRGVTFEEVAADLVRHYGPVFHRMLAEHQAKVRSARRARYRQLRQIRQQQQQTATPWMAPHLEDDASETNSIYR